MTMNPDFPDCPHDSVTDGSCNRCGVTMRVLLEVIVRQREALELVVKQHKGDLGAPPWFDMMGSVKAALTQEPT